MLPHTRVLLVDGEGPESIELRHLLTTAGYDTAHVRDAEQARSHLQRTDADVVLLALAAGEMASVALLAAATNGAPIVALVADAAAPEAHEALRRGAFDCQTRGKNMDSLLFAIERAARTGLGLREVARLRALLNEGATEALVGRSGAIVQVRELIGRAAASRMTVCLWGEAGTGKDLAARIIHDLSDRATRPFITLRCAGVDGATLESELFGATGGEGSVARAGLLEEARGGTLVLDEFAHIPHSLRERLVQVLATGTVSRAGAQELVQIDIRLVLVSRQEPAIGAAFAGGASGGRLSMLPIAMPPLRERRSDVPLLIRHFRERVARECGAEPPVIAPDMMMGLLSQQWPGNVRELAHFVERYSYQPAGGETRDEVWRNPVNAFDDALTLAGLEQRYILHVLAQESGHQSRAAERLGIDRRTLYRKLKEYG